MIKKIAILTSGGDSPGMNNAIIAITKNAILKKIKPYVVYHGYKGLFENQIKEININEIEKNRKNGGTFIFSSRFPEFKKLSVRKKSRDNLIKRGIDAVIVIGGDGTYRGAQLLHELGIKTIALPGTIDNDITSTDITIGYNTALESIVQNIERLRDTMTSHNRVAIVEVMGHGCGDLALYSGLATGAEIIVTNENKLSQSRIAKIVKEQFQKGKSSVIIVISEFIYDDLDSLAHFIEKETQKITRAIKLGHIQRGGSPTALERIASSRMGIAAVDILAEGQTGVAIGIVNNSIKVTPIKDALKIKNKSQKELAQKFNKLNQV